VGAADARRILARMPPRALDRALASPPPRSVSEVVELMRAIESALPRNDGVAWFTRLYLAVTEGVEDAIARASFRDERFVTALDVSFANLYFDALRQHTRDAAACPRAWAPLVEARRRRRIAPIQFALAGMNAHINRDLPVALADTWRRTGIAPRRRSPHHVDFLKVNALLAATEARVKIEFARGVVADLDRALGSLDDVLAMWNVERARDAAWVNGEALYTLRAVPPLARRFLASLDRMVGFAGRGLLRPLV
jgi:hypothetical protein